MNAVSVGCRRIKWRKKEWLLVGSLAAGGAIATEWDYCRGLPAYAYLTHSGMILRFGQQIGVRSQIEDLGPAGELKIGEEALVNMLNEELWAAEEIMN
jgi:hypothetical protein